MFPVQISKQTFAKVSTGQGSAGAATAALTASPRVAAYGVYIRNHHATAHMFVGDSNLTAANGFRLDCAQSIWIPVEDPRDIYVLQDTVAVTYSFLVV